MNGKRFSPRWAKAAPFAGLLFLCLLWSLGSLRIDLLPALDNRTLPLMEKQALPFALLAITASLFAVVNRTKWPRGRQILSAILIGLGLFVAPAVLVSLSNQGISELTRVALFSLVPVFTVVLEPHISGATGQQRSGALIAALLAVAGTFLIFPAQIPNSVASSAAFVAIVLAAACTAAANCLAVKTATESPITTTAAIAGITVLACFAMLGPSLGREAWTFSGIGPELVWSAAVGLPALLLLFWLMRRMSAVRMTTRFVIAPLITALCGIILFRPEVSLRAVFGLVSIAAGAAWLLFAPEQNPDEPALRLN
jgi:drug/metabolite transporter (DMT)-like permease